MKRVLIQTNQTNISYELYKELASELCAPINDTEMTLQLRFELYQSKLIYLYNLNEQCFKCINSKNEVNEFNYTLDDLVNIKNAIEITREFLRQTIRDSFILSTASAKLKGLYASRFQKGN
jgi:hypothetical protein